MLHTPRSRRGMVTAPHHLASEAGLRVLREGGTAIEAAVAMAAALPVVYPHMTSIGGDGFWLVAIPGKDVVAIDACGAAAEAATPGLYHKAGHNQVPWRGPLAANTVAGTISGWGEALRLNAEHGGQLPLSRLVEDAAWHAEHGFAVTRSQAELTAAKRDELKDVPGFAEQFLVDGEAPREDMRCWMSRRYFCGEMPVAWRKPFLNDESDMFIAFAMSSTLRFCAPAMDKRIWLGSAPGETTKSYSSCRWLP